MKTHPPSVADVNATERHHDVSNSDVSDLLTNNHAAGACADQCLVTIAIQKVAGRLPDAIPLFGRAIEFEPLGFALGDVRLKARREWSWVIRLLDRSEEPTTEIACSPKQDWSRNRMLET